MFSPIWQTENRIIAESVISGGYIGDGAVNIALRHDRLTHAPQRLGNRFARLHAHESKHGRKNARRFD